MLSVFKDALKNCTVIVINEVNLHSFIKFDKVLVLKQGMVDEYGDYDEKANDPNSNFSKFLQRD